MKTTSRPRTHKLDTIILFLLFALRAMVEAQGGEDIDALESFENADSWIVRDQNIKFGKVPGPHEQNAVAVTLTPHQKISSPGMMNPPASARGKFNGLFFEVFGDGSENWGRLEVWNMIASFAFEFPLKEQHWVRHTVSFGDLVSTSDANALSLGSLGGGEPGYLYRVRMGASYNNVYHASYANAPLPAVSYRISEIRYTDQATQRFPNMKGELPSLQTVAAKLAGNQPLKILCLGDSLTVGERPGEDYPIVLEKLLQGALGRQNVSVASGGRWNATIKEALVWVEHDFAAEPPDLVTLLIGSTDKFHAVPTAVFRLRVEQWLNRFASATKGRSAIALITPPPGAGFRFAMQDDYADAIRGIASARALTLVDLATAMKQLGPSQVGFLYSKRDEFLNACGHELVAKKIADALLGEYGKVGKP